MVEPDGHRHRDEAVESVADDTDEQDAALEAMRVREQEDAERVDEYGNNTHVVSRRAYRRERRRPREHDDPYEPHPRRDDHWEHREGQHERREANRLARQFDDDW